VKRTALLRHLREQGCTILREGGGHTLMVNPANLRQASIPRHREVATYTMLAVCRQLEVEAPRQA